MVYIVFMYEILRTEEFDAWIAGLRDRRGQKQVLVRLVRLSLGHWGDCRPVGGEVTELRIHSGPGYRGLLLKGRRDDCCGAGQRGQIDAGP